MRRRVYGTLITCSVVSSLFAMQPALPRSLAATAPIRLSDSPPVATIKIDNFAFVPRDLEIKAGTTVTWQNADDAPHTVTHRGDPRAFDSGALETDQKFAFTFTKPGIYTYFCKIHSHMTGTITVK